MAEPLRRPLPNRSRPEGSLLTSGAGVKSGIRIRNPARPSTGRVAASTGWLRAPEICSGLNNSKPYEKDEGEWNEGRQSGRGTQDWSSGRYDGELQNSEPHGRGVLTLQSARYEGEFRDGKPYGSGTVTNLEGVFKGNWRNGCLVGDKRNIDFGRSFLGHAAERNGRSRNEIFCGACNFHPRPRDRCRLTPTPPPRKPREKPAGWNSNADGRISRKSAST